MEANRNTRTAWKRIEGIVNTDNDHIKITYGTDSIPVAFVAPGGRKAFIIEFLSRSDKSDRPMEKILDEVRKELDFYLVEKGEEDPWKYSIHHCRTAANLYSEVHWGWHPASSIK